jgi:hypothetical protein
MESKEQINHTSYYRLPCGLYLEDFIEYEELDFKWGCAVKYKFRAGKKEGESEEKDLNKCLHYVCAIASRDCIPHADGYREVCELAEAALRWRPTPDIVNFFSPYRTDWRPVKGESNGNKRDRQNKGHRRR